MSQLSVIGNQGQISNISTDKIEDNKSDVLDGIKQEFDKETSMEKMEELGGPRPPKPESTMHKVGRFLTGILGGLLLAAGVAAAVAATVASCGLAAGVVAGVAATVVGAVGVTGASVIAGAAGATGIGLIAGSRAMKPKNPEALSQPQQAARQEPAEKGVPLTKMGGDEADTIAEALKTNHGIDVKVFNDTNKYMVKNSMNVGMTFLLSSIDTNGGNNYGTVSSRGARDNVIQFASSALTLFGIDTEDTQASPKNALMVRYAIDNYLLSQATDNQVDLLNNGEVKQDLVKMINDELKQMPAQTENYHMLAIFRDALNLESVPKPQQNPVIQNDLGINLISNPKEKTVSLGNKKPDLSKILPKKITFGPQGQKEKIMEAIKALVPNYPKNKAETDNHNMAVVMDGINIKSGGYIDFDSTTVTTFSKSVLEKNNVTSYELTQENVLFVRYAIASFFSENYEVYDDEIQQFNDPNVQQQIASNIADKMNECERGSEDYKLLAIFRAALTETDLSKLDAYQIPTQLIKA